MPPKYRLNFYFDWLADTVFASANDAAREEFGIALIDPTKLPLSQATNERVYELSRWHDGSLNWEYPPDPGPWRQEECDRFNASVQALYQTVVEELGPDFEVVNDQPLLVEDPDLDEYLKDPNGFRRKS